MSKTLQPAPIQAAMTIKAGTPAQPWVRWFQQLKDALTAIQINEGLVFSAGALAIPQGSVTVSVVFSAAWSDLAYVAEVTLENVTDPSPRFLSSIVTKRTLNGFTVTFNAPTDTANYKLNYRVTSAQ